MECNYFLSEPAARTRNTKRTNNDLQQQQCYAHGFAEHNLPLEYRSNHTKYCGEYSRIVLGNCWQYTGMQCHFCHYQCNGESCSESGNHSRRSDDFLLRRKRNPYCIGWNIVCLEQQRNHQFHQHNKQRNLFGYSYRCQRMFSYFGRNNSNC